MKTDAYIKLFLAVIFLQLGCKSKPSDDSFIYSNSTSTQKPFNPKIDTALFRESILKAIGQPVKRIMEKPNTKAFRYSIHDIWNEAEDLANEAEKISQEAENIECSEAKSFAQNAISNIENCINSRNLNEAESYLIDAQSEIENAESYLENCKSESHNSNESNELE